jgi:hypothetical protein
MRQILIVSTIALALLAGVPVAAQDAPPPPANEGTFDALSVGNQKVVSSIYESQLGSANDQAGGTLLTRDDIAAMKADGGWGNTYKQLYDQGLVTHRNLGQAISSYNHASRATATTTTVVTTGDGQQIVSDKKGGGGGNATLAPSGGKAGGQAGGVKADHAKNAFVTTGAGGAVAAGPAGPAVHSSAGGMGGGKAGGNNGHGKGGL